MIGSFDILKSPAFVRGFFVFVGKRDKCLSQMRLVALSLDIEP
jgi:hypothetical protein